MRTVLLTLALLVLGPATASADQLIATVDAPTPISAYHGRVAWSQHRPDGRFQLMLWERGQTTAVPVAPRSVPFDADLGPNAAGHVAVVYSRCVHDPPVSSGFGTQALYQRGRACNLFEFDLATRREHKLTEVSIGEASEVWPSIWRGTIAFERAYEKKPRYPYLYVSKLGPGHHSRRMPGGQRKECERSRGRSVCSDDKLSSAAALELSGSRLAFAWTFRGLGGEGLDTEIRLDTVGHGHRRLEHQNGGGLTQVVLASPSFESGRTYWSKGCFGDPGGCPGRHALLRQRNSGGATQRAPAPAEIVAHDRDGGRTYLLEDTGFGACISDPGNEPTCRLVVLDPSWS